MATALHFLTKFNAKAVLFSFTDEKFLKTSRHLSLKNIFTLFLPLNKNHSCNIGRAKGS